MSSYIFIFFCFQFTLHKNRYPPVNWEISINDYSSKIAINVVDTLESYSAQCTQEVHKKSQKK